MSREVHDAVNRFISYAEASADCYYGGFQEGCDHRPIIAEEASRLRAVVASPCNGTCHDGPYGPCACQPCSGAGDPITREDVDDLYGGVLPAGRVVLGPE